MNDNLNQNFEPAGKISNEFRITFERSVQELKTPQEINFHSLVKNADITAVEEIKTLYSGFVPTNFDSRQLKGALELYAEGVQAEEIEKGVDFYLEKHPEIEAQAKESLYAVPYLMSVFKEYGLKENSQLQKEAASLIQPQQIQTVSQISQDNFISFGASDGGFQPVLKKFVGIGTDLAKEKATSLLKNFAGKAIDTAGKKIAKEAAKKGAGLALKAGVQAAASTAPIVGNIAAFIATEVLPKVAGKIFGAVKGVFSSIGRFLTGEKDFRKQVLWISAALAGLFLALGMVVPAAAAGLISLGAGASIVGGKAIGQGISGVGQSAIYGITHVAVPSIAAPTLIAIFVIPITTALILFIINSSAYLVPPSPYLLPSGENLYIGIEKVADPSDVDNPPPRRTINYTVTITARQGTLTNISFSNDCQVFGEATVSYCPSQASFTPTAPTLISPTEPPFTFSYTASFDSRYRDSVIVDTFRVTADAPGAPGQTTSATASVIIGNPPTGCFVISNNALAWPSQYRTNMDAAIRRIVSQYPAFAAKVCAGPQVNLCFDPPSVDLWGWHVHRSDCDVLFDTGGLTTVNNATYILTHEASHHMDRINGTWYQAYVDSGATSEDPVCSYRATFNPHEGFAEGNALYVQLPSFWGARCNGTYQSLYPLHWQFADEVIF